MKGIFDVSGKLLLIKATFRSRETLWTGQITIAFFKICNTTTTNKNILRNKAFETIPYFEKLYFIKELLFLLLQYLIIT